MRLGDLKLSETPSPSLGKYLQSNYKVPGTPGGRAVTRQRFHSAELTE